MPLAEINLCIHEKQIRVSHEKHVFSAMQFLDRQDVPRELGWTFPNQLEPTESTPPNPKKQSLGPGLNNTI